MENKNLGNVKSLLVILITSIVLFIFMLAVFSYTSGLIKIVVVKPEQNEEPSESEPESINEALSELKKEKESIEQQRKNLALEIEKLEELKKEIALEKNTLSVERENISKMMEEINKTIVLQEQETQKRMKQLAKIYGDMKPDEVVSIFREMDDETIAALLIQMKSRTSARILGKMESKRASLISKKMKEIE